MPLFPEDIENKSFLITLRGYDKDEVRAFLRQVAEEFKAAMDGGGVVSAAATSIATFHLAQAALVVALLR